MIDLSNHTTLQLLKLHNAIEKELQDARGILRTQNPPAGDYAEWLFCNAFGFEFVKNSTKSYDVRDSKTDCTYQIKGRRPGKKNNRELSAIRCTDFDFLVGILFEDDYRVMKGCIIPKAVFEERLKGKKLVEHTASYKFLLPDKIWSIPDVTCITDKLKAFQSHDLAV